MKLIELIKKIFLLGIQRKVVRAEDIGKAYTFVSDCYENTFLKEMHVYNDEVLNAFIEALPTDTKGLLDLACGTGYNSEVLARVYTQAQFYLVDISKGMLEEAKKKQMRTASFIQKDMLGFLKEQPDESLDGVICCWAIKYQPPRQIIKEVYRILKPGGIFGVLVNTKKTLPEIRKIYPSLLLKHPETIQRIMFNLPNPNNKLVFLKWFKKARFQVLRAEEGKRVFHFRNEEKLIEWVTHTGALAGFDCMLDLQNQEIKKSLEASLMKKRIHSVTHRFVWAILKK
ncbi:class I SAM-dependent methyltransferase [Sporanaerobium hydrogeniformans]|uniref:class I SAM-dependent methyltransferase n=1 Tax=Sporanaerobium hydrogeniformans TaxID=3072179 RepID=UPI0015D4E476|nr:class I SAM-dependent methyltransferase [Sporanaerobium hydrogeniformans]